MWHVHNEYGCHNQPDLLRRRRRRLPALAASAATAASTALNAAWGTAFWSQRYYGLGARSCRRARSGTWVNPTQQLDFARLLLR